MASTNRRETPARSRRTSARPSRNDSPRRRFDYPRSGYHGLHRWLPSWRVVLGTILGLGFLGLGAGVAAYAVTDIPDASADTAAQTTTVYFADTPDGEQGSVMGTFAVQKREIVEYESLPAHVGEAVVAAEDRTFFTNSGVSITGMGRAFLNNIQGGRTMGGSTLTQQYVERYYAGTTTSDYVGKAREALIAIKIGRTESKEQILGRYLNTIYYGRDAYGIQVAAQSYFGVDAADLTVSQAALLAGIIPSPNNWDPATSPEKAEQRWNYVLDNMVADGWITADERAELEFPETVEYVRNETYRGPNGYLLEMVRDEITTRAPSITDETLDRGGLTITTTIEEPTQDEAVASATELLSGELTDGDKPNENLKLSITSIDPTDGAIVALYGGADYLEDSFNRAAYDKIQAGSTFKPFALVAGLEAEIPLSKTYAGYSPQEFDDWTVQNFSDQDFGTIDLVKATEQSVNTVYAQLNLEVTPEATADVAARAGITTPQDVVRSNVLGSDTVHPLDMANSYATFAAQGEHHDTFIVREVLYDDDTVAYQGATTGEREFAEDVMADATYALTQVVENGSGERWVKPLGRTIAGKTGTSSENKSAWFVGYSPTLATAVSLSQVGEDGSSQVTITPFGGVTEVTGGTWPSALWARYMGPVLETAKYDAVTEFPERAFVGGKPTPTATSTPTPTATEEPTEEPTPTEATVPSGLEGRLEADATAALVNAGLVPVITSASSDTVGVGRVISVSPGGGASVAPGDSVTLVISTGPEPEPEPTVDPEPEPTPTEEPPATEPPTDGDEGTEP